MEYIPAPAKERLLHLLKLLERTAEKGGEAADVLTSGQIEQMTGWSSATIRKDLSFLGEGAGGAVGSAFGYVPATLLPLIKRALGLDKKRKFCVVGLGRLGSALLNNEVFESGEFVLAAGFDTNVNRTEILKSPAPLYPAYKMAELIGRFGIELAILCVPKENAQAAAEKLAAAGIRGIVNFCPVVLNLPPGIAVQNVYVSDALRALAINIQQPVRSFYVSDSHHE